MLIRFFHLVPTTLEQFFKAVLIFAVMGLFSFVIGELLPRSLFNYQVFPFRSFRWEKNGKIYLKLGIWKWKDRVPDMSKYVKTMFAKEIVSHRDPEHTHRLILETCVAELIHEALILLSPLFQRYLIGIYGDIAALLYALGNLPFVLIQRYNRPRLVMLMEKQLAAQQRAYAAVQPAFEASTASDTQVSASGHTKDSIL